MSNNLVFCVRNLASIALATTLVAFPGRAAAGPASDEVRAVLEIDTSEIGSAGPVIRRRVEERSNLVLRRGEILPGNAASDPVVGVTIREITGEDPGYGYEIWVSKSGAEIEGSRQSGVCELCTESELVERVEDEVEKAIAFVRKAAEAATAGDPEPPADDPTDPPPDKTAPPPGGGESDKKLGPYGKAGIGTVAGGAVALGAGIALAIRQPSPAQADPLKLFTTRPAGFALIGLGAAAAITGTVLVVLDRKGKGRTSMVLPTVGPRFAGMSWGGRF